MRDDGSRVIRLEGDIASGRFPTHARLIWCADPSPAEVCKAHLELGHPVIRLRIGTAGGYAGSRYVVADRKMSLYDAQRWIDRWCRIGAAEMLHLAQFYERKVYVYTDKEFVPVPPQP